MTKLLIGILLLTVLVVTMSCASRGESVSSLKQTATFPELAVKQELQRATQSSSTQNALTITPLRTVKNGQGAGYVFPASLTYSDSGTLYVSDNNGHRIHYWPPDSPTVAAFSAETGNGTLKFPNTIHYSTGQILISDNDGIKIFSPDGRFQKLIRSYLGVFSFVRNKQSIFVNTIIRKPTPQDLLIVELDPDGKLVKGMGLRRNVAGHNGLDDQAYLAASDSTLFVAFKYRPSVEIYDVNSGKLSGSFEIKHPVFGSLKQELERKGIAVKQDQERVFLPRYLSGIRVLDNKIFVCLALPEPEIWVLDQKGDSLGQFRVSGLPVAVDVFGFDVRQTAGGLLFSIGIIDQEWNATISELKALSS